MTDPVFAPRPGGFRFGRPTCGSSNPQAKLTEDIVAEMLLYRRAGWPTNAIASIAGVRTSLVSDIVVSRRKWSHVRLAERMSSDELEQELESRRDELERWTWAEVG
jgi:hypothetical protein